MAINVPLNAQLQNATQLQQQVQNAVNAVRINLGGPNGARALSSLSQPLGRLTGQADEFTKSLDAANARVLAFGASVGVVNAVSNAFKALVSSTIEVEKAITEISVVGEKFTGQTKELTRGLFEVSKLTGQSFAEVSKAALEFARQGQGVEETLQRTKDALILTRTTGLDAAKSVDGLTAAVNAFAKAGLSTTQVLNKLAAVDQAFAVSSADLIEAFQRTGAVAQQAGVSFDELAGIVTALQTETSRGGAVIGNALKTIFSRLQDTSTLTQLQDLGVAVQDLQGNILPARQILQNLAGDIQGLSKITQAGVFKDVAGTFQLNQLVSLVNDLNKAQSISAAATQKSAGATNEAYIANEKLNQSLDAILNKVATTGKQLGSLLGEIGLSDNLKGLLDGINSFLESVNSVLQGDDIGSKFAKGFVKGIGSVLSGPGLGVFLAIVVKLSYDLLKFGAQSLKTFFGIGKAANDQKQIQESIVQTLLKNQNVLNSILSAQGGQNAQGLKFLGILNQQAAAMQSIQSLAGNIAGTVYSAGYRQTPQGLARRSAGGYLPAQEAADVRRGVGGASPNSKVVAIPNFAFGGGKRGTMIANTSEYIVPNYAGGGSAIFNPDMVKTMGLPAGAKKITAAGGFVPNFKGIRGLQGKSLPFNYQNYVEDSFLSNLKTDKAPVILAGRIFEALARGDKFIDLYENKQSADIDKGAYKIAEAKLSVQAGLKDPSLGMGKPKGNRLLVPLSSKVDESQTKKLKEKGISLIKHNSLTHPLLFAKAREVISQYSNKTNIPNKIKIASSGYIPNFANYIYDSDKIQSAQRERILQSILSSTKRKNLLVGPAGSGKSTAAAGLGTFIKSIDDLRMASSFTILSSSGLSSKGGFTESFQNILSAVNRSGGKTTYLGTTNEELMRRRGSRTLSEGDVRSAGELSGTAYAPLNQSAFIKQLKKESGDFQLQKSAKSNFSNDQLAVLGLYGQTGGNIDGSKIYTLSSQQPNITRDIKKEYEARVKTFVRSYSQELANKIGIKRSPKEVKKSIQQSDSVSGFIFEDVLNQLAGKEFDTSSLSGGARVDFKMTPNLRAVFGTGSETFAEAKLNPYTSDAQSSVRSKQAAMLSGAASLPKQQSSSSFSQLRQRWINYKNRANKKGGFEEFQAIVKAAGVTGTSKETLNKQLNAYFGTAAAGYIPNFAASALQQAIAREKSAGLSDSQIYVDQSPSLKSPLNPMGLMVANTRDEPFGGIQGISRARKEGMNPKTYGAANGFVPNFAPVNQPSNINANTEKVAKGFGDLAGKFIVLQSALSFFQGGFTEAGGVAEKFSTALQTAVSAVFAYQAIQQLQTKNNKIELLRQSKSQSRKDLFITGVSDRALGRSRGGILGGVQYAVGTAKRDLATSTLGSFAGAAGASLIALKSFNDIASLFYTKSPKVAQSLELMSSAAGKATSALNDIDKSKLAGVMAGSKTSFLSSLAVGFGNLSPFNLGKKNLAYRTGTGQEQIVKLAGGQTEEDFAKTNEYLTQLIFTNLRASLKDFDKLSPQDLTQSINQELSFIYSSLTDENGILDLSKTTSTIQDLIKKSDENVKKIAISTSNIEFNKPLQIFKRTIENIIFQGAQDIEDASQDLQRRAKVISAITSSKSFATLGDSSKIAFEINSSLEQFNAEYNNKIKTFLNETQTALKDYLPELGIAQEKEMPILSAFEAVGKATDQKGLASALQNVESQIQSAGVSLDNTKFQELKNKVISSTNAFSRLIKEQDNELAILQFNNQEKLLEAKAYDTYRKQLGNFVDGVIKSEKSLIALRGAIERIDVSKNKNIEIRSAYAKTTADTILIRMEEEISAMNQKRDKEIEASFQEAQIAAQREFFTKENIAELNRNTVALENLTNILAQDFVGKIDGLITDLENGGNYLLNNPLEIGGIPLPSGLTENQQVIDYLKNLKNTYSPNPNFIGDGGLQNANQYLSQVTDFVKQGINANQGFGSIQSNISGLGLNQSVTDKLTKYAEDIFNAAQKQSATWEQSLETARATYDSQLKIYEATNSYVAKLDAQRRSLVDSLTDPQTLGEYNTKLRQINRQDYESALPTDQARQTYRSSFSYGFSEAMDAVEQRTLDFRNQLGKEIPDLFSQNLAQGLNDAISGAKSLKEALTDAATSFFQEITRRNISNLADLVTGGIGNLVGGFIPQTKASGGLIRGGSGTKDDVPAMLMGGEYVVKKSAVNKYGKSFLDAINSGSMRGYATGGMVDPQTFPTQTGRGGFFTPGDYGQGAITGKNELLTFASQSFTGGQYDYMGGFGMGGATVSLEPESARLSALGREGSPMFERVQQSKDEAFKVYLEGLQKEKEYAELLDQISKAEKARKKQLQMAIISAVVSSAASYAGSTMKVGAANASAAGASKISGAFKGYQGQGGLFNMFSKSGTQLSEAARMNLDDKKLWYSFTQANPQYKNPTSVATYDFKNGQYRASGGLVSGGSSIRDDVPAMLTGGEFVLNNRATQRIGLQNLNKLNSGAPISSEGASAEMTQALISKLDELIQTTANSSKENVVVNVSTNEAGGQTAENPAGAEKELHKKIRQAVLDVIAQEKRLGGSLEKSR